MFTHDQVWQGIDRLARERGLTASGLARRAGLDPTTFNPSKRVTKQRKPRWPSTESLAKILNATGTSLDEFVALMSDRPRETAPVASHRLRCISLDQAVRPELFDESGFPVGSGWDEIDFPNLEDPHAYALEIRGDDFLPTYRDGEDRKSTRLNSSHVKNSYAVFSLKKKTSIQHFIKNDIYLFDPIDFSQSLINQERIIEFIKKDILNQKNKHIVFTPTHCEIDSLNQ